MTKPKIQSINIGKPQNIKYKNKEIQTGIYKTAITEAIFLGKENFDGDQQADLVHHGGVDKAVCVYPVEHYQYWEKELNRKLEYGAFGENLTVSGLTEGDVCIGDTFQVGEAVVQISQPRQPCFKLAAKHSISQLPVLVEETGYTGYYFRVIKVGIVEPGATINLLEKHPHKISVYYANKIMHHDKSNFEAINTLLEVDALSASWRKTLSKRLAGNEIDPKQRLEGN
ncbi:MOSC domain-containing protein [Anaerobacillus alkaliphilus]|uniref:MOSC domain-containing protein n=1 Tax=Anaerobacillus alkaliphilus TaxID=1548597 RepID=A0A4Q0VN23_9BACI|nr:MOSC domain-containing protein [Anaerobacillus alkaliphilus]RXI97782.1 MOSC domain-containing protein [Anaerobacillus alkaliphilus]